MKEWIGLPVRLVVGGVWIVAGALKLGHPADSVAAVKAYQLLSPSVAEFVGYLLPPLEIAVGVCLVIGLLTRLSAIVSGVLFVAFIVGIASVWARGIEIDCGCFGGGGAKAGAISDYPWEIARDAGLFLLSAWLVVFPRTRLALDTVLFRPSYSEGIEDVQAGQAHQC